MTRTRTREAIEVHATEPYSKVIRANGFAFVKSHVGNASDTGAYPGDIASQTRNNLANLEHSLEVAGSSLSKVLRVNVYMAHIDQDFAGMSTAFTAFFTNRGIEELPARTTIGVPLSWPQLLVQMDLVALE
jgi:enamine deaminase RidA (YjgF/YER057c/UK114 family)